MEENKAKLNSSEKVIAILLSFIENQETWGIRELATKHGFAPGTVQRIINALKEENFLEQNSITKKYQLGLIYFKFFNILHTRNNVIKIVRSSMEKLCVSTKETICHHVKKEQYNLCIDKIQPADTFTVVKEIGTISPLYTGASSKCLLAFSSNQFIDEYFSSIKLTRYTNNTIVDKNILREDLELIRDRGYAHSIGEKNIGIASVSAPFYDHSGSLLGAISIDIPEYKYEDDTHRSLCVDSLLSTVQEITHKFKPL